MRKVVVVTSLWGSSKVVDVKAGRCMPSISSTPFTVIWERVIVLRRELSGNRKTEFLRVSWRVEPAAKLFFEIKLKEMQLLLRLKKTDQFSKG